MQLRTTMLHCLRLRWILKKHYRLLNLHLRLSSSQRHSGARRTRHAALHQPPGQFPALQQSEWVDLHQPQHLHLQRR